MQRIDLSIWNGAYKYGAYQAFMDELVQYRETDEYTEDQINYTRMNIIRMERLDKITRLREPAIRVLEALDTPLFWLVLTEPWCGDAAQILPVLNKMATSNENIKMGLLMRDRHPAIMDAFLTNGSRSIPIVIVLSPDNKDVLGAWGPRPFLAQGMIMRGLEQWDSMPDGPEKNLYRKQLYTKLHKWYARDKTSSIQEEFSAFLEGLL